MAATLPSGSPIQLARREEAELGLRTNPLRGIGAGDDVRSRIRASAWIEQ